jgi:Trk K+ transport system NAD-binding subunit
MGRWLPEDHLVYFIRHLRKCPSLLLLAIRNNEDWIYNPPGDHILEPGSTLIFMINPEERLASERIFLNR